MNRTARIFTAVVCIATLAVIVGVSSDWLAFQVTASKADRLELRREGTLSILRTDHLGDLYKTDNLITDQRIIEFDGSSTKAIIWTEIVEGSGVEKYALSIDGRTVGRIVEPDHEIKLLYAEFDPIMGLPEVHAAFAARAEVNDGEGAYIVQFVTQPLEEYRRAIRNLGGKVFFYLPQNAYIVHLPAGLRSQVEQFSFVRWVGKYEPAYKLRRELAAYAIEGSTVRGQRYSIMLLERGDAMQSRLVNRIVSTGGKIINTIPEGFRVDATLTSDQLIAVAHDSDVLFIDKWGAPELDMEIVRGTGGANFIENMMGFRGEGVRAEVMDNELRQSHGDFQSGLAPLIHNSLHTDGASNHGTSTYGIIFGRGSGNSAGRGLIPEAQGIFSKNSFLTNRYVHTDRLLRQPYNAVFQSNSWGSPMTQTYHAASAELDDILFLNDIVILQSQGNSGTQWSRPEAWAKNAVSVGGIIHQNNADDNDDRWDLSASIGPAADGRIKPDLAHYYDSIMTTHRSGDTSYINSFGGTSAATPITAGHFGIFYQMWHQGLFRNSTGATVFDSRPRASTAKAIMINTAIQWDMTIPGTDTFRERQGWGRANVENLYNLRNNMFIVDGADSLMNVETRSYAVSIEPGSPMPLKVTMVYSDPMGSPSASRARVNDLSLRVTSPSGVAFWGNHGLGVGGGMWSVPGGSENNVDTVENVFIKTPEAGLWNIEVIASEINQDAVLETSAVDAAFSLVASGVKIFSPTSASVELSGRVMNTSGRGIAGAQISVIDRNGIVISTVSNAFGYYSFLGVRSGETYIIRVAAKRHQFQPAEVIREVLEDLTELDFISIN